MKKWQENAIVYGCVCGLSTLIFITIYGWKILNVTYTDWLMYGTDLTQHYLGWKAYRLSQWSFPFGLIDNLSYPFKVSVIYTDSIPLLAVPCKLLSGILPKEFQYFGLWGLGCYILQGVLAAHILGKFTQKKWVRIIGAVLLCLTPVVIQRMYYHSALAGQWVLFIGIGLLLEKQNGEDNKKLYKAVLWMAVLSALIHMYFVLMNGIILMGICLKNYLEKKNWKIVLTLLLEYVLIALLVVGLLGGFSGGIASSKEGLGDYAFNLNGFVNPYGAAEGTAVFFRNLPIYAMWADEGYTYMGAGIICVIVCAIITFCIVRMSGKHLIRQALPVVVTMSISLAFAASPRVAWGNHLLFEIPLPNAMREIWAIFRATGRVAWVAMYIIIFVSLMQMSKLNKKGLCEFLLMLGVIIQVFDLSNMIKQKHTTYAQTYRYESPLHETIWNEMATDPDIKHIIYVSEFNIFEKFTFTQFALENDMTTNDFYFARSNTERIDHYTEQMLQTGPDDTMFIFSLEDEDLCQNYDLEYNVVGEYIIGTTGQ